MTNVTKELTIDLKTTVLNMELKMPASDYALLLTAVDLAITVYTEANKLGTANDDIAALHRIFDMLKTTPLKQSLNNIPPRPYLVHK
jgi:hypothetical protein